MSESKPTRSIRRPRGFAVIFVVVLAATALGGARAAPSTKLFETSIVQTSHETYLYTLRNAPTSSQTLGSANVTVPAEHFGAVSVLSPIAVTGSTDKSWTARVNLVDGVRVIELRANTVKNALAPGQQLDVEITFSATCSATAYPWPAAVKQSNNFSGTGNDYTLSGPVPASKVAGPPVLFEFAEIGAQVVDREFEAVATALDACSNPVVYHAGEADLSGLRNVPDQRLTFAAGVAEAELTPTRAQVDAQLTLIDADGLTGPDGKPLAGTSDPFNVFVVCTSAPQAGNCVAGGADGTIVSAQPPTTPNGKMELSLTGSGKRFSCDGTNDLPVVGSLALVVPDGYTADVPIPVTIRVPLAGAPSGSRTVCISKTDGVSYESVSRCTGRTPILPCETGRSRIGDALEIRFLIDPEDPWVGVR